MVPRGPAVPLVALRVLLVLALGGGVRARAAAGHGARNRELFEALRARVELDVLVAPRASGGTERSKAEPPRAMRLVDSFGRSLRCAAENTESGSGAAEVPVAAPGAPRESRRKQSASSAATSSINSRSEQTDEVAVNLDFLASECAQKQLGWWTYRWCHLQSVRQFHVEKDGTLAAETSLGLFDETASNAVNLKSANEGYALAKMDSHEAKVFLAETSRFCGGVCICKDAISSQIVEKLERPPPTAKTW